MGVSIIIYDNEAVNFILKYFWVRSRNKSTPRVVDIMANKPTKLEFAVQMTCQNCVDAVKEVLTNVSGIQNLTVDLASEQVTVETTLTSSRVQELIESTGRRAVLRGMAAQLGNRSSASAAVAIVTGPDGQQGVIRLVQSDDGLCLIDGTVDGLVPGTHAVCIHEFGDLSQGCDSCGKIFELGESFNNVKYGELGLVEADEQGRAEFRIENTRIKIWEVIGRSAVIHRQLSSDGKESKRVACGIVARSSGLFENTKRICACDGLTLWDERSLQQKPPTKAT